MACRLKKLKDDLRTIFNMHRIEKTKKPHDILDTYDKKRYSVKRKKLREELLNGEKVLVLAERIKKKLTQASFISNLSRISYFNKERTFIIIFNRLTV